MLDKSGHNKFTKFFFLITILLKSSGCSYNHKVFDTEVSCAKIKIVVRFAQAHEVRAGIERALDDKRKFGTSESYTVIRMPGNRSFKIEKLPPEEAIKCSLRDYEIDIKYRNVEKYYH